MKININISVHPRVPRTGTFHVWNVCKACNTCNESHACNAFNASNAFNTSNASNQ